MRVTCFQHIDCEGPGTLSDIFQAKGVKIQTAKPFKGDPIPSDLGDGLVVMGGPMGVYEEKKYPWMTLELNTLCKALNDSIPVLGICLGAQMLAHASGGQVYRGALPEVGWYPVSLTSLGKHDPLFLDVPREFTTFHWHNDTFALTRDAVRLAESEFYSSQVFRIGQNAYGFQCHLEVTEEMARTWMALSAKDFTPQGGPLQPQRVEENLVERAKAMEALAGKIFTRFAALL